MKKDNIDFGKEFDWGKASKDYAKYRDIYPDEFYNKIIGLGYCKENQKVLDLQPVPAYYREICINSAQNGRVLI